MLRTVAAALGGVAFAGLAASAAQAVNFDFHFDIPLIYDGQVESDYVGSGRITAEDLGDGQLSVTGVTGVVNMTDVNGVPYDDVMQIDLHDAFGAFADYAHILFDGSVYSTDGLYLLGSDEISDHGFVFSTAPFAPDNWDPIHYPPNSVAPTYYAFAGEVLTGPATLTFDLAPAAAPEAATWGLMLIGFGATGAAMRRRRTAVTFA